MGDYIIKMTLEIWVHGHYQDINNPTELDILSVTGNKIPVHLLDVLLHEDYRMDGLEDYEKLATERAHSVDVEYQYCTGDDNTGYWYSNIISHKELPERYNEDM